MAKWKQSQRKSLDLTKTRMLHNNKIVKVEENSARGWTDYNAREQTTFKAITKFKNKCNGPI